LSKTRDTLKISDNLFENDIATSVEKPILINIKNNARQASDHPRMPSSDPRVIFLEDDHSLRQGLTDFLRLNSITVTEVASAAVFETAMQQDVFDVALLDINLPDGDGFAIAASLRIRTQLGIILLTARTARDDRLQGYGRGADLFFTKPVDGEELVLAIANLTRRVRGAKAEIPVSVALPGPALPWRFDQAAQCLLAPNGGLIRLSGREARMIERLARLNGEVVSRQELAEAIGYGQLKSENRSVDAVLRRLRNKVRQADMELPVHAVHAMGFRFSVPLVIS
jgi:DNA-binding response OmpR family regulator